MMLRPRKSFHAVQSNHKLAYNMRRNANENAIGKSNETIETGNNNIQGSNSTQSDSTYAQTKHLTTPIDDDHADDMLTASTTSLSSQRGREQSDRNHDRILTKREFHFKRNTHYNISSIELPSIIPNFGLIRIDGGHGETINAQKPSNSKPKKHPGGARWHTNSNPPILHHSASNGEHDDEFNGRQREKSILPYNSIRGIRRPRQWLPPALQLPEGNASENWEDNFGDDIQKLSLIQKGKAFCIEFLQGSSIHGFIYLAKFGLSIVERMLWFAFICGAVFSIISLSHRTWQRFQTSPMVISMDRNKLVWNTSFPSLTVCPHKRIDEIKVEEYMTDHEEHFPSEQDKEEFRDFILKLASLTYDNIETLPLNKTFGISSEKYLDLLYELKWNFEPEMSSGAAVKMYIFETLTEFGICHSVNSLVARYNSYNYWKQNDWNLLDHGDRVTVHPLDGEIYAQIINLSTAYDVYFHSAGDIPNISKQRYTFPESDYTTVELIALEIYTAEEARAFTTKQRKCRFRYEAEEMLSVPIYSFGLCLAECRMFFSLRVCGCVPHFYRNRLKTGRVLPICGFDGLRCLSGIKRDIISLKSDRYKINCNCLSNCDDSNFFVQSHRSRVWFLGANLQWGIIDYPKMQLRRDVLFSFADVLVYIGGLVGFFLGCSILSFTEVLYYFTARFVRRMVCD